MSTPAAAKPSILTRVLLQLVHAVRERSAEAVGGTYAQAARSLLTRSEQLEDLRAERRHQRRVQAPRRSARKAPTLTAKPTIPPTN